MGASDSSFNSGSSGGSGGFSSSGHYGGHSSQATTDLFNTNVVKAETFERPLSSSAGPSLVNTVAHHEGVVLTTADGSRYLAHKGNNYGQASMTVVTPASNMSSAWKQTGSHSVNNSTVGDFVKAGGKDYNAITDNCQHAADRMNQLP